MGSVTFNSVKHFNGEAMKMSQPNVFELTFKNEKCPYCGVSDGDAIYDFERQTYVWYDNEGELHEGWPIDWGYGDIRPGYAFCLNCRREFKVEERKVLRIEGEVENEAQIRRRCPKCGYAWVKFGKTASFRYIGKFKEYGIVGFRCLICGETFYYAIRPHEAPSKVPRMTRISHLKSVRENMSWQDYRVRFKTSVFGTYPWSEEEAEGVKVPEKSHVKATYVGFMRREKYGLTRTQRERAQVDFEKRVKKMIELAVEHACFSQQKQRILEDALRYARYIWLNVNKAGRTAEYIMLAILHYVYAVIAQETENVEQRELFPIQRFWQFLSPYREISLKTYEKNVDFVLNALQVAYYKNPKAFKMFMMSLIE
jgi:ribosomal protein S27AE